MQHSVKLIGKQRQEISELRGDKKIFDANEFFEFAKENASKYKLEEQNGDLLVSTWYSDALIFDFTHR